MSPNLKDILTHLSTEIDQETLLQYLQDQLSDEKKTRGGKKIARKRIYRRCYGRASTDQG